VRSVEEISAARDLTRVGLGASAIARRLGLARSTVRYWQSMWAHAPRWPERPSPRLDRDRLSGRDYAYLLGLYLGDGCITAAPRGVFRLRIKLDSAYPRIVAEAAAAMDATAPANKVARYLHPRENWVEVSSYSRAWPTLLPQHGSGRKHERRIDLAGWQRGITHRHPRALVRGMIHSDGCRFVARQRRGGRYYEYPRYAFSNVSADIRSIFCEHLDLLGVSWTFAGPNRHQVAVATRGGVAMLDEFVGPKS
jgi:hypothetical protein